MIRINLLSEGRRPVVARRQRPKLALGDQDPSAYFLAGGLILGLLIVGVQYFRLSSRIGNLDSQIASKQEEVNSLREILDEVEAFKQKQADLERKIEVIQDLSQKQQGPVNIMDKVSRALPDLLWLTQMNFRGENVDLAGTAYNTAAIASFIESLAEVPEFKEPDPQDLQRSGEQACNFRITFAFRPEQLETESVAGVEGGEEGEAGGEPAAAAAGGGSR
jgi:type IV pilus assembly protein PilN